MKRHSSLIFLIPVCVLLAHFAGGQEIAFDQLTTSNTSCLLKDNDGFVWIGTQDGLLRYDGSEFRVFRHLPEDTTSLPNNFIWCLAQDPMNRIWVGTYGGGLALWNKYTETFTTFFTESETPGGTSVNSIRALKTVNDSTMFIGTEYGLLLFDLVQMAFRPPPSLLNSHVINAICVGSPHSSEVLVGTNNGLYAVSIVPDNPTRHIRMPVDSDQEVYHILHHDGRVYVGSEHGLFVTEDFVHFSDHLKDHRQPSVRVKQILVDDAHDIWLATDRGLGHYERHKEYQWYHTNRAGTNSLRSNNIQCIAQVDRGILFAGTSQGLHQFSTVALSFQNLSSAAQTDGCPFVARDILEDGAGNVWVTTDAGIMKILVTEVQTEWNVECFNPGNTRDMPNRAIHHIFQDSNQDFWLATDGQGFVKMDHQGEGFQWERYPTTASWLGDTEVTQIFQDSYGDLWIATEGKGLLKFFPAADAVRIFDLSQGLTDLSITQIYEDRRRQMWIATANGGLCQFERKAECFTCYVSDKGDPENLLSNTVYSILEDFTGRFWICTADGVNIRQRNDEHFASLTSVDGLPTDTVFSALEDKSGSIWLNTLEGVVRVQDRGDRWFVESFDAEEGLPGPQSQQRPFLLLSSGLMFFGGDEGIVVWNPDYYNRHGADPAVALTDLQLFGASVAVKPYSGEGIFTLDTNINDVKRIVLEYNQNSLGFKFSAIQYGSIGSPVYAYRMAGVDEEWIRTTDRRFARYPNLPPGHYQFMVGIGDRQEVGSVHTLDIRIRPPWWRSWWMYMIYAAFGLMGFYALLWIQTERTRAVEQARITERDRMREKVARDFHDEAGNQITVLSLLTERARQEAQGMSSVTDLLDSIQEKIQQFRSGMRDFIWIVDPRSDTLFEVVKRFGDFAEELCEQAGVEMQVNGKNEALNKIVMAGQIRRHFLLIFKEALHNSLKHSGARHISFSIFQEPQWTFVFEDDGKGFDCILCEKGNGLFNMRKRAEFMHADFVVETSPGSGTRVILQWDGSSHIEPAIKSKAPAVT